MNLITMLHQGVLSMNRVAPALLPVGSQSFARALSMGEAQKTYTRYFHLRHFEIIWSSNDGTSPGFTAGP
jgi:hypothetical protein